MQTAPQGTRQAEIPVDQVEEARLEALDRLDVLDTPPEPEFDRIARLIKNIFGVNIAIVSMIDAHRQWYKACVGMPVSEVPRKDTFCTLTVREAVPIISTDAALDPRFSANPHVVGEPYVRFYAGMPLKTSDGYVVGTLCAIDDKPRDFGPSDIEIMSDLADIVMAEIELRRMAGTDILTGTLSRRAFKDDGATAVALSLRHQNNLSCIAVDLDHFKQINDTYGHAAGDKVLVAAANAIKASLRQSDRIARIGGEEFAVLLPHTSRAAALEVAEKLRANVEAAAIDIGTRKVGVTASFGVASLDIATKDMDTLLAHADAALYEAKSSGRNRCVGWRSQQPEMSVRRRVLKAGRVEFNGRQSTIDCTVRSLSEVGAGIAVSSTVGIPKDFILGIPADGFEKKCHVTSRTERQLEVEFR